MRSIVRRDTGESYQAFLTRLAETSGIQTPTREALARLDRKRKKKTSNKDWTNPHDLDAKVTKMKDGRTHLRTRRSTQSTWRPVRLSQSPCKAPIKATRSRSARPRRRLRTRSK